MKNRYVWVKDCIQYHDAKPFTGGPLWQVRKILSRGDNWMLAEAESRLLIYFIEKPGSVIDVAEWEDAEQDVRGSRYNRYTYYQRLTASSQDAVYFDTLLIPLLQDDDPQRIVASINVIHHDSSGATTIEIGSERLVLDPNDPKPPMVDANR